MHRREQVGAIAFSLMTIIVILCSGPIWAAEKSVAGGHAIDQWMREHGLSWLEGIRFKADFQLRYQGEWWEYTDADGKQRDNDRHRARFRLRFGITKEYRQEGLKVGFRLASGSSDEPTSTSETLGSNFDKKQVWIDLAYVEYRPPFIPGLLLAGGKVKNPFVHTDVLWDSDVNLDGAYQTFALAKGSFRPFVTIAEMSINEFKMDVRHDSTLLAGQAGMRLEAGRARAVAAVAYYDFDEFERNYRATHGNPVDDNNVLAAGDFNVLDVMGQIGMKFGGIPFKVTLDYAVNTADDARKERYFGGKDSAFGVFFNVGKCIKKGDWQVGYKYGYIQPNAVPGDFCDATFGHANRKGHKIKLGYQPFRMANLQLAGFFTRPSNVAKGERINDDVIIQADFNVKL